LLSIATGQEAGRRAAGTLRFGGGPSAWVLGDGGGAKRQNCSDQN